MSSEIFLNLHSPLSCFSPLTLQQILLGVGGGFEPHFQLSHHSGFAGCYVPQLPSTVVIQAKLRRGLSNWPVPITTNAPSLLISCIGSRAFISRKAFCFRENAFWFPQPVSKWQQPTSALPQGFQRVHMYSSTVSVSFKSPLWALPYGQHMPFSLQGHHAGKKCFECSVTTGSTFCDDLCAETIIFLCMYYILLCISISPFSHHGLFIWNSHLGTEQIQTCFTSARWLHHVPSGYCNTMQCVVTRTVQSLPRPGHHYLRQDVSRHIAPPLAAHSILWAIVWIGTFF